MHLLIPFALCDPQAGVAASAGLRLPALQALLRTLAPLALERFGDDSLTPAHERVVAALCGVEAADGCVPGAAMELARNGQATNGQAWAWITPVHCVVGADRITLRDPQALALQEPESRALLAAMQPYFAGDAIDLQYAAPTRWLARGDVFGDLPSAALDRAIGRDISRWMPRAPSLRRLQNEMQMLLYTHPVNDARSARGALAVNSFWVSGSGRLNASASAQPPADLVVADALRVPALAQDWVAWAQAWQQVDATHGQALLAQLRAGAKAQLTLCAPTRAARYGPARRHWLARLRQRLQPVSLHSLQQGL